jgi:predicted Zn-dependent protease
MEMFKEEFGGLPGEVALALQQRLEEVIRRISSTYGMSCMDPKVAAFSAERLQAMIHAVFETADRIKTNFSAIERENPVK